jgi:2-aminobenzoate-CoA ligase
MTTLTKQSFLDPSGYEDHFVRERLPPADLWPDMRSDRFVYPKRMNAAVELLNAMINRRFAERSCIGASDGSARTYNTRRERADRIANVLVSILVCAPGAACCRARQTSRCWRPRGSGF